MDRLAINQYIQEWVSTGSEDAFFGLVESQEECLEPIKDRLQVALTLEEKQLLFDVLKEIRLESVTQFLDHQLLAAENFEEWKMVAEARFYQDSSSGKLLFRREMIRLRNEMRAKEAEYCLTFFDD